MTNVFFSCYFRPQKIVWHGSTSNGDKVDDMTCNHWHSSSPRSMGYASSLLDGKLVDMNEYSCNNRFIVLCVENTSRDMK